MCKMTSIVEVDFSFKSCDHLNLLFQSMFGGCQVSEKISMGPSKVSYCVRHGLDPLVLTYLCGRH